MESRFTAETTHDSRTGAPGQERVRIEAGRIDGELRIEVSIQYRYESGRKRGCFSYVALTPEQAREFAAVMSAAADRR